MSNTRYTRKDVENALAAHVEVLRRHELIADGVTLHVGQPFGRPGTWQLWATQGDETGHHEPPIGASFLGLTAREAYYDLTTRTRCVLDVMFCQSEHGRSRWGATATRPIASLREVLRGATDVSTDDHKLVVHYSRPVSRDDARGLVQHALEVMDAEGGAS